MSFEELLMKMNWNEDLTLIFVKTFLKHECLWNPLHPDNKVMFRRKQAHLSIISEFKSATMISLSVEGVKKKIQRLREQYIAMVKKKHKSTPDCIYDLSPKWFHEMDRCLRTVPGHHNAIYARQSPHVNSSHTMQVKFQSNNSEDINNYQQPPEVDSSDKMWVESQSNNLKDLNTYQQPPEVDLSHKMWVESQSNNLKDVNTNQQQSPEVDSSHKMWVELQSNISKDINTAQQPPKKNSSHKMRFEFQSNNSEDIDTGQQPPEMNSNKMRFEFQSNSSEDINTTQQPPEINLSHKMRFEFQSNNLENIDTAQQPPEVGSSQQLLSEVQSNDSKDINTNFLTQQSEDQNNYPILRKSLIKIENHQQTPITKQPDDENNDVILVESKINMENHQSPLQNLTSQSRESSSSKSITVKEDEFDMYGKFVACQLKKIRLDKALRLQLQIQNLVCEARLSDLPS